METPYIETPVTGQFVPLNNIDELKIVPIDIVVGLSNIKRYNGRFSVTVLEHSFAMYEHLNNAGKATRDELLYALIHDAAEAYIGDLIAPVKSICPEFAALEGAIQRKINAHFGIDLTKMNILEQQRVKRLDVICRAVEVFGYRCGGNESVFNEVSKYYGVDSVDIHSKGFFDMKNTLADVITLNAKSGIADLAELQLYRLMNEERDHG